MGEAKRRGTYEQRKAAAITKKAEVVAKKVLEDTSHVQFVIKKPKTVTRHRGMSSRLAAIMTASLAIATPKIDAIKEPHTNARKK